MMLAKQSNVIVGAGQAADWAAVAMRKAGFDGKVVMIGDEDYLPYERPPLSKDVLVKEQQQAPAYFRAREAYDELGVERLKGLAVGVDPGRRLVRLQDGREIHFDRLLFATGARPRRLPASELGNVYMLRTYQQAQQLRQRLREVQSIAIVGGGVIGLEVAASAVFLGAKVTVVDFAAVPMARTTCPEVSAIIRFRHEGQGVAFEFSFSIARFEQSATGGVVIEALDGRRIEADIAVVGIGIERNIEIAQRAGILCCSGIVTDNTGRTNLPNVYAAGEVAEFYHPHYRRHILLESWKHAQNHGAAVGTNMAGQPSSYDEIPWSWSDQYDQNYQFAGLLAGSVRTVLRGSHDEDSFIAFHMAGDGRIVAASAANRPRDLRFAMALIRSGRIVPDEVLADDTQALKSLT